MLFTGGSEPKPATNTAHLRLYHHNLCPFSGRARYSLSAKAVPFQECMVDLNEKAQWHIEANGGAAPLLETTSGDLIPESSIIARFALESNPDGGIQLIPTDPVAAMRMRVKMEDFNKTLPGFFPMVLSRG